MARSLHDRSRSVGRVTGLPSKAAMARLVIAEALQAERDRPPAHTAVPIRVKTMDRRAVWLRPRSRDRFAFEFLFDGYHLPPPELTGRVGQIAVFGANIGLLLGNLADRYRRARLLGVEPDRDNAALARRNLAYLGARVTLAEAAVWHRAEPLTLNWERDAWGQIVVHSAEIGGGGVGLVNAVKAGERRVDAIDAGMLLDEWGHQKPIDYLLVNIESAWYEMLKHGEWTRNVRCIKIEIQDHYDEAVPLPEALGYHAQLHRLSWGAFATGIRR